MTLDLEGGGQSSRNINKTNKPKPHVIFLLRWKALCVFEELVATPYFPFIIQSNNTMASFAPSMIFPSSAEAAAPSTTMTRLGRTINQATCSLLKHDMAEGFASMMLAMRELQTIVEETSGRNQVFQQQGGGLGDENNNWKQNDVIHVVAGPDSLAQHRDDAVSEHNPDEGVFLRPFYWNDTTPSPMVPPHMTASALLALATLNMGMACHAAAATNTTSGRGTTSGSGSPTLWQHAHDFYSKTLTHLQQLHALPHGSSLLYVYLTACHNLAALALEAGNVDVSRLWKERLMEASAWMAPPPPDSPQKSDDHSSSHHHHHHIAAVRRYFDRACVFAQFAIVSAPTA